MVIITTVKMMMVITMTRLLRNCCNSWEIKWPSSKIITMDIDYSVYEMWGMAMKVGRAPSCPLEKDYY